MTQLSKLKEKMHTAKRLKIDKKNYDLLNTICSHSGFTFNELYYINANRFFTCIQIHDFPQESYAGFINNLINEPDVFVKLDISSMEQIEYDNKIEKALKKSQNDFDDAKKFIKASKANKNKKELLLFNDYVDRAKETVKMITIRLYVAADSYDKLMERTLEISNILSRLKMRGFIQTNDLQTEMQALTSFDNPVAKMVASSTVADCMMRSDIKYINNRSVLIGLTKNGLFAPNPFLFEHTSYGKVFMSKTGGGKSALIKRMIEGLEIRGNHIQYIFDIHDEYNKYCKMLHIPIVSLNEKTYVNIAQLFYTEHYEGTIQIIDITNKIAEIEKTFITFNKLDEKRDKTIIMQFRKLLRVFYEIYIDKNINELKNEDWFTLSEVMKELKSSISSDLYRSVEERDIYVLDMCLDSMCNLYGFLFDNRTNIDFDLTHSLCFDFSFLQNNSDKLVKASYMEMFLNYVSYGFYLNKRRNEQYMEDNHIRITELEEPVFTCDCLIEEFMECAVSRSFLDKCRSLVVYARKAYCGLSYIIHTTKDLEKGLENNGDLLEELFALSVHKYIGEIDGTSLSSVKALIPCLSEHDLQVIRSFRKGADGERQFMGIINDSIKIPFTSILTDLQKQYYGGGR